jgi:ribonucleoside-diphosphate reductase beta chain
MGLFDEQISRKPNKYTWTTPLIKSMQQNPWTVEKFTFSSDVQDFKVKMNDEMREMVVKTVSAISQIEVAVKKFWARLGDNLPHPSITDLGYVMGYIEVVHNEAYEKLLEVLDMEDVFEENLKNPVIAGRVKYLRKYLDKQYDDQKRQYIYAIILFSLFVENVSLFSQFYIINWFFRFKGMLKDTSQQTDYTVVEESLHFKAGAMIINTLRAEYPGLFDEELKLKIMDEALCAYECEEQVIDWILGDFEGERINSAVVKEFVKYKLNEGLIAIGYDPLFEINPDLERDFEWFNEQTVGVRYTDTFYKHATEYIKNGQAFSEEELW